ncbi:MAG TPA: hypothetical protein VNV25_25590 [Gemmatimonadaceae bacterium]|nr:hypothetical protein [Gemmatimonadaceae bacterium]
MRPQHVRGLLGAGDAASAGQQYLANLKTSYTRQGDEYVLNTAQATAGVSFQGLDFSATVAALARGDIPGAVEAADSAIVAYASLSVPVAGLVVAGFTALVAAAWSGQSPPCTAVGCGSTFGMGECPTDSTLDFTWAGIASSQVAPVPPAQPYHFSGGPDTGPSNLIDWGSYDWQDSTPLDPTKPGGPGSFEQALELVVMQVWDRLASAPQICDIIRASGLNPSLTDIATGQQLQATIWGTLATNIGALVPVFLAGWNAAHGTGTITTNVPCTQASCEAAGGIWIASDSQCGRGGVAVPCTTTTLAPQRQISHVVGSRQWNDPLSVALEALAQIQGLPVGSTLVLMVNSGPPGGQISGWDPHIGNHPPSKTSGLAIVGGAIAVVAVAAGGFSLWAYLTGQAQSEAWKKLGRTVWDEAAKSGEPLVSANPLKGAKLLGAGEAAEEPKRSGHSRPQSLLFPRDRFTKREALAWSRSHGFKASKADPTANYWRVRQFSPAKGTVVATIPFGSGGIKATIAR